MRYCGMWRCQSLAGQRTRPGPRCGISRDCSGRWRRSRRSGARSTRSTIGVHPLQQEHPPGQLAIALIRDQHRLTGNPALAAVARCGSPRQTILLPDPAGTHNLALGNRIRRHRQPCLRHPLTCGPRASFDRRKLAADPASTDDTRRRDLPKTTPTRDVSSR